MTRLPTRPEPGEPEVLDDLEELGDDAIIAQQTAVHVPRPRAVVSEESRSVVITDQPAAPKQDLPRPAGPRRSTAEPTLIIRDRRRLDEMRQQILERQVHNIKRRRSRSIYVWGVLGLAAFVLGGIVAFLATDSHSEAPAAEAPQPGRSEAQIAAPQDTAVAAVAPRPPGKPASAPPRAATAVRPDQLPVEPAPKK